MKTLTHLLLLTVPAFSSILNLGCPEEKPCTTCPPPANPCDYPAGNRNFAWRLDTVAWWPSEVGGVWAFSDTDAWIMGNMHGPTVAGQTSYLGLHWDGRQWNDTVDYDTALHLSNDVTGDNHYMVSVGYWAVGNDKAGLAEFNNQTKKWKAYQFQTKGDLRSVWSDGEGYFIAGGDGGMVYTKDGYTAEWVYSKAPTEFSFYSITGISKSEIYACAYQSLATGEWFQQGWKFEQGVWKKLYDTQDTAGTPLHLTASDSPNEIGVWRCSSTDSLKLYVIGDQSYLFQSIGQQLDFRGINLSDMGLPLKQNGRTGLHVFVFNPNDVWITGTRYNFYHWNGSDFQKIVVPGLPNNDTQFGSQLRFVKTASGRIFIPSEVSSQVYVMVQGAP